MNNWKVTVFCNGKTMVSRLKAKTYSDAYVKAEKKHPECRILSIKRIDFPKSGSESLDLG
jgi:hypothetical protein